MEGKQGKSRKEVEGEKTRAEEKEKKQGITEEDREREPSRNRKMGEKWE